MARTLISQRFFVRSAAVAALLALGACGSSSTSATTTPATVAVTAAAPTGAATTPLETNGTPTPTETDGSAPSGDDSTATIDTSTATIDTSDIGGTLSPNASPECKELFNLVQPLQGGDETLLPSTATLQKAFASMKSFVPDELKADVDTFGAAYIKLAEAVNAAGGDMKTAISKPEVMQALQALSAPDVSAASDRVGKYLEQKCPTG